MIPEYKDLVVPAKTMIPQWYKDIPRWGDNKVVEPPNPLMRKTLKHCMPFMDTLTSGYFILLGHTVYCTKDQNGNPYITAQHEGPGLIKPRHGFNKMPTPHGYNSQELVWIMPCSIKIPSGYSMLITHPFNRFDLPFYTLTGMVDGGYAMPALGQIPFYIKDDFEGFLERGTPIMQVIPFKNDKWSSIKKPGLLNEGVDNHNIAMSTLVDWYKKNIWTKKDYI